MLTREEILAKKAGHEVVELFSGGKVTVRGLTRDEAIELQDRDGIAARDNYLIATGLVEPKLSEEDVAAWGANGGAADLLDLSNTIGRISGMVEGAGKSGVPGPG